MASSDSSENKRAIMAELVRMFAVFPVQDQSREGQKLRLETYLEDLAGFPSWAVQTGCTKVRRGLYGQLSRAFAPTPAELAEIIREILLKDGKASADGSAKFEGEIPMTWVVAHDPRWDELCRIEKAANPKSKPFAMMSQHASGVGRFFRTEYVDAVPMTAADREAIAQPTPRERSANARAITIMPPPRPLAELRALKPGAIVSYEEAMLLTGGKPPRGRWDDPDDAKARAANRHGKSPSDAELKAGIAERMRASYPPREQPPAYTAGAT